MRLLAVQLYLKHELWARGLQSVFLFKHLFCTNKKKSNQIEISSRDALKVDRILLLLLFLRKILCESEAFRNVWQD